MRPNRLIHEKSPYLRQHAFNPVDWYPWGPEAFEKAKREQKPIFLSIGYSTCHWCHVMERESFQSEGIAEILNREFVPIKVDREERPDVDRVYMTFVQVATGGGGWPLSVWLTPDLKPFYGGTYYPPEPSYGRPSFRQVLERVAQAWKQNREQIVQNTDTILSQLKQLVEHPEDAVPVEYGVWVERAIRAFEQEYDQRYGGFGQAPKFPRPSVLYFLLRAAHRHGRAGALQMVLGTLSGMLRGGIHDHIGGGFHRYAVDRRWLLPHFEKMLYDQAQLAIVLLEAYQSTEDPTWALAARRTLDYMLRDLSSPAGGFYSAEDADSPDPEHPEQESEGAFYLWRWQELADVLGPERLRIFAEAYGCRPEGNLPYDPHGEFQGKNLPYMARSVQELAVALNTSEQEVQLVLEEACRRLFELRTRRPRPHRDEKIITAWNGLAIAAFSRAAIVCQEPRYELAAQRAAKFIRDRLYDSRTGLLFRRYCEGEASVAGFLDDYAFLAKGCLELFDATYDPKYLEWALRLTRTMLDRFEDREHGGFHYAARDSTDLVLSPKDDHDGAEPAASSVALEVFVRLHWLTGDPGWREAADRTIRFYSNALSTHPDALPYMLAAAEASQTGCEQILIIGQREDSRTLGLLAVARHGFHPDRSVVWLHEGNASRVLELLGDRWTWVSLTDRPMAYVCREFRCELPAKDPEELMQRLNAGTRTRSGQR